MVVITAGCGTLGGRSVVIVSRPGLESLPRMVFLNELLLLFRYLPRSAAAFLGGTFGTVQVGFAFRILLLKGMLLVWLLMRVRRLVLYGLSSALVQSCLTLVVVVDLTGLAGLVEALRESD